MLPHLVIAGQVAIGVLLLLLLLLLLFRRALRPRCERSLVAGTVRATGTTTATTAGTRGLQAVALQALKLGTQCTAVGRTALQRCPLGSESARGPGARRPP